MQFQPGDIVQLKSGGPRMMVRAVNQYSGQVNVVYVGGDQMIYEPYDSRRLVLLLESTSAKRTVEA